MTPTIESLGLTALPLQQKLDIAHALWEHLLQVAQPALTDGQLSDLDRRLADIDAHPEDEVPWDEARGQIRERLGL